MIRHACPADVSRIAEILIFAKRTAYRSIFQNDIVSFNDMQVLPLAMELQKKGALDNIVVYDDGIIKGMMNNGLSPDPYYQNSIQIFEFYIEPLFQNCGIGSFMLQALLNKAQNQNAATVQLWVLEKNHTARSFYEKFGFRHDGCIKTEIGTNEKLMRYVKYYSDFSVYKTNRHHRHPLGEAGCEAD